MLRHAKLAYVTRNGIKELLDRIMHRHNKLRCTVYILHCNMVRQPHAGRIPQR